MKNKVLWVDHKDKPGYRELLLSDIAIRINFPTNTFTVIKNRYGPDRIDMPLGLLYDFLLSPGGHCESRLTWVSEIEAECENNKRRV